MNYSEIGRRIRTLRLEKKYTQKELAQLLPCTPKHLGNIERGNSRPSLECLFGIAKVLNVSLDYLVSDHPTIQLTDEHSKLVLAIDCFLNQIQNECIAFCKSICKQ